MNSSLTALSLFSGCGGDTLGLERAGFKVVAFNEFNKAAIASHLANFPDSVLLHDNVSGAIDITKIPDPIFEEYKGKVDVIFAGFPCQGFSQAGKKKSSDPRNQLFRQFVRVTRIVKPLYIIGENVTGLTKMKSGPKEDDPLMLDLIRDAFKKEGYEITYQVLEATSVGVPQKRKRILIVGWDTSRLPEFEPASFWADVSSWGNRQNIPLLRSFITNSMEGAYLMKSDEIPEGFQEVALSVPSNARPTGTPHPFVVLKTGEKLLSCTKRDSPIHSEIINLDLPSKTIICTYDHQPRLLVGLRKANGDSYVRTLLPDELKQIQGFPLEFKLEGNTKEKIVQVGNAVPPALVTSVAHSLAKSLSVEDLGSIVVVKKKKSKSSVK